ncbi:MAG: hypothetical protein PHG61_12220 [Candidatus Marinimicrobia bacterium]|nr:hypothetical protein [Candidatus Neomarinimicrobiota bacterium]
MNKITKRIIQSSTWAASTDLTPVDLPREGIITEVTIRANLTATLTAAAYDDWFRRVIQSIKIQGDGGHTYLGMGGEQMSTILSLWNNITGNYPTIHSNGAGIALSAPDVGSTAFTSVFKFHPGNNPRDRFDLSAGIPAMDLSTLQILLSTTAAAVTDAAGPITAGTFNYEISEVVLTPDEKARMGSIMTPLGSTLTYSHTANYSDFGYNIDVPGGAFLRSIIMRVMDDTATVPRRKDDEVTAVKFFLPRTGEIVFEQNIYELKQSMMSRFGCPGIAGDVGPIGAIATIRPGPESLQNMVPAGFVIIDLREFGYPGKGIDMRNMQTGDMKLGLTIANFAAGDDTTFYFDQLMPYSFR